MALKAGKRVVASLLSVSLALAAPGLGGYSAFAHSIQGAGAPVEIAPEPVGGLSVNQVPEAAAGLAGTAVFPLITGGLPSFSLDARVQAGGTPKLAAAPASSSQAARESIAAGAAARKAVAVGQAAVSAAAPEKNAFSGRQPRRLAAAAESGAEGGPAAGGRSFLAGLFRGAGRLLAGKALDGQNLRALYEGESERPREISRIPTEGRAVSGKFDSGLSGGLDRAQGFRARSRPAAAGYLKRIFGPRRTQEAEQTEGRSILNNYMKGMLIYQLLYVTYYALFTTLAFSVVGPAAPAVGRLAYIAALIIAAPISGVLARYFFMRTILIRGLIGRLAIYAALLPAAYMLLPASGLYAAFAALMFLDGALISIYALVGPEYSGPDFLEEQYKRQGVKLDSNDRNRINAQLFFWLSAFRIFWAPVVAGFIFLMKRYLAAGIPWAMLLSMGGSALLTAGLSIRYFRRMPQGDSLTPPKKTIRETLREAAEGIPVLKAYPEIAGRMFWSAMERAMDDAMLLILVPMFVLKFLAPGNLALGAVLAVLLPAMTKFGSIIASWVQQKYWKAPPDDASPRAKYSAYRMFLRKSLYAGTAPLLLIPAALLALGGHFWPALAALLLTDNFFNYNIQRTQQGLRIHYQDMVKKTGASSRIMGLGMTVNMLVNSLLVVLPAMFFACLPAFATMAATAILFALIAGAEFVVGRRQQFSPEARGLSAERAAREKAWLNTFNRGVLASLAAGLLAGAAWLWGPVVLAVAGVASLLLLARRTRGEKSGRAVLRPAALAGAAAAVLAAAWTGGSPVQALRDRLAVSRQRKALLEWQASPARTMVVAHSLSLPEEILRGIKGVEWYDMRNLAATMAAADPNVHVVFVTAHKVDEVLVDHVLRGRPDREQIKSRLRFIDLEGRGTGTLAQKLLDPGLRDKLEEIREAIRRIGAPAAFFPFMSTPDEWKAADALGLGAKVWGAHPSLRPWAGKSGSRRIFRGAGLPEIAGKEDVYSERALVRGIESVLDANPGLKRIGAKLNDGVSGLGNAVMPLDGVSALPGFWDFLRGWISRPRRHAFGEWLDARGRRKEEIRSRLSRMEFNDPSQTWNSFRKMMAAQGVVVEAWVEGARYAPSGQAEILPDGSVRVLSTHEQILTSGGVYLGASFPAREDYRLRIQEMTEAVGKELSRLGALGRFGVDFLAVPEPAGGWKLFPLEINLRLGGTTHPYVAAMGVTGAAYDARQGALRLGGRAVEYEALDHHQRDGLTGIPPGRFLGFFERPENRRLLFNRESMKGVVFHLVPAVELKGNVGYTIIGADASEISATRTELMAALDSLEKEYQDGKRPAAVPIGRP